MKKLGKYEHNEYTLLKGLMVNYKRNKELKRMYELELDGVWYRASGAGSIDYSKPVAGRVSSKGDAPNRVVQMIPVIDSIEYRLKRVSDDIQLAEDFMQTLDPLELKLLQTKYISGATWYELERVAGIPESTCRSIVHSAFVKGVSRLHHNNDIY